MRTLRPHHQRGFVLLVALGMLMVVAVAILALAGAMSADGRRTVQLLREAQLEQMLLAGAADAGDRLESAAPAAAQRWMVALPPGLAERGGSLETSVLRVDRPDEAVLLIRASLDGDEQSQTVRFQRQAAGAWRLVAAELGDAAVPG